MVRDASAVGEIQICPKCGSMVLVEAPPGWSPPATKTPPDASHADDESPAAASSPHVVASQASVSSPAAPSLNGPSARAPATSETSVFEPPAGVTPMAEPPAVDDRQPPIVFDRQPPWTVDEPPVDSPPSDDIGDAPPVAAPPVATADVLETEAAPVPPDDAWASATARSRQQWLMLGGAAMIGIGLSLGLTMFFATRVSEQSVTDNDATPAPHTTSPNVASNAPLNSPIADHAKQTPAGAASDDALAERQPEQASAPATGEHKPQAASKTAAPKQAAADTPAKIDDISPSIPAASAVDPLANGSERAPSRPHETKTAAAAASQAVTAATKAATSPEPSLDSGSLAETLRAFAPFIDPDTPPPPETVEPPEQDVPPLEPVMATSEIPSVPRPEPRVVDVAARLQDKIAEVEFTDVPLTKFVRFLMNFSTIPISLDPDALALVGVTPRSPINLEAADATVDQLLNAALGPSRLSYVTMGQQLLVTRAPLPGGGLRTVSHNVADLVASDPRQLTQLAELIAEMVEPESWDVRGGAGVIREEFPALVIQQQETILLRAIVFCERLRAARGLPPQSKFDPRLFSLEPRHAAAARQLAQPVTLNIPQPTALTRILDRLGDLSGLDILIDWQALGSLGWTPDTETTLVVNDRPIGDVLTELLQPMELAYRALDARGVQITSPAAAEARWDIEFYPAPAVQPGETSEAMLARLRNELAGADSATLNGVLAIDAPSKYLIAALPQDQQQKLVSLLHPPADPSGGRSQPR